ncbi:uncharacterized protein LOC133498331 [Syngnathoides biaculeatus]|uniref:uncharacterized protein LOC133498331 n=1 Tax=Syngnathoides biaculeatus TaxID=300417 RepID=UPI002ADD84B4|nr:uncharacterized protein LOC133498331 [Syngnathoides biaculeatus]
MDGQGDGDHNGPNRHHIHIPTEDQPPNGDNNDMEFIFLLHFIINHHMRVFRQNQIGFVNENIVNVHIENHAAHIHQVIEENEENEDESDNDFSAEVQMVVNQVIEEEEEEEEEEPQPGPSRYRSRDEAEQDEETRIRKCSRWWHEFDNTSDSSVDLDNDEEPLLSRSDTRSRDRLDSDDNESVECVHELAKNCRDLAEDRLGSTESADLSGQEGKKNSLSGPLGTRSTDEAGHKIETTGSKYFQWWLGVEDNSSDSGSDLDGGENPLPGDSGNKSRDDLESGGEKIRNDFRPQEDVSSMPNCVRQVARSIQEIDLVDDEGQSSIEDESCRAQEGEEHSGPSKTG